MSQLAYPDRGIMQRLGGSAGNQRSGGTSAYNPVVANTDADLTAYRRSAGRAWLSKNPGGDPADFEAHLMQDPQYLKLNAAKRVAQDAHVLGVAQPDYDAAQAANRAASNAAEAITTDAGSRQTLAQGSYNRDTGAGFKDTASGQVALGMLPEQKRALGSETDRLNYMAPSQRGLVDSQAEGNRAGAFATRTVAPAQAAALGSQAALGQANANSTNAMIAPNVAQGNAGAGLTRAQTGAVQQQTMLMPQIVTAQTAAAQHQRAQEDATTGAENTLANSEAAKNLKAAGLDPSLAYPNAAPGAGAAPVDNRGLVNKVFDALWGGAKNSNPITGSAYSAIPGAQVLTTLQGAYDGWNGPQAPANPAAAAAPVGAGGNVSGGGLAVNPAIVQRFATPVAAAPQRGQFGTMVVGGKPQRVERVGTDVYLLNPDGSRGAKLQQRGPA